MHLGMFLNTILGKVVQAGARAEGGTQNAVHQLYNTIHPPSQPHPAVITPQQMRSSHLDYQPPAGFDFSAKRGIKIGNPMGGDLHMPIVQSNDNTALSPAQLNAMYNFRGQPDHPYRNPSANFAYPPIPIPTSNLQRYQPTHMSI